MASLLSFAPFILVILVFLILAAMSYVKAPPNQAYLISGPRKKSKIIIGRAGFKIPFLERLDKLHLGAIAVDVQTRSSVPTSEFINVRVDANVNVRIGDSPTLMAVAAKNFLNQGTDYIVQKAQEVLEGNMREIVGQMKLTDMVSDRQLFAEKVRENAAPDMEKLGLEIISFNVQNFKDDNGIIDDLGIDNVEKIKKDAAIAKSNSRREVAIAEAEDSRKSNEAQVEAATQIAKQNTSLDICAAELKAQSELKRAAADAAYGIQQADQRKVLEVAGANADIARTERETELKRQQIELKEKELDAVVRKQADANLYKAQKDAEAQMYQVQKVAEGELFKQEQAAQAIKMNAEAARYAAEQEAEGIRAKGLAEAEAIEKKAEAQKKMGEASVMEMYLNILPQVVAAAAEPLRSVDKITMYGTGNSAALVGDVMKTSDQIVKALEETTGLNLGNLLAGFAAGKILP